MLNTRQHVLQVDFAVLERLDEPVLVLELSQLLQTEQEEWIEKAGREWRRELGNADDAIGHRCSSELRHVRLG